MLSKISKPTKRLFNFSWINRPNIKARKIRIQPAVQSSLSHDTSHSLRKKIMLTLNAPSMEKSTLSEPEQLTSMIHKKNGFENSQRVLWHDDNVRIRQMEKDDLSLVLSQWAKKEQWNPGKYEVDAMMELDPTGYYMLEKKDDQGKYIPITSIAAVKLLPPELASLGLYITIPGERGKGYGTTLWYYVLGTLTYVDCVVLNAVKEQVKNYERSGFKPLPQPITRRCMIHPSAKWKIDPDNKAGINVDSYYTVKELVAYQHTGFPAQREAFLKKWLAMSGTKIRVARNLDGKVIGYGIISQTEAGYKIAPLFANNVEAANRLCLSLCQSVNYHPSIQIDLPEGGLSDEFFKTNEDANNIQNVFETVRMFHHKVTGSEAPEKDKYLIASTSLEFS